MFSLPKTRKASALFALRAALLLLAGINFACSHGGGSAGPAAAPSPPKTEAVYAYVTNTGDNTVSTFKVNPNTGDATAMAVTPVGRSPRAIAVSQNNPSTLYVANTSDNTISQFHISDDGVLHPLTPAVVTTDGKPVSLQLGSDGCKVANQGSNTISIYKYNPDGTLNLFTTVAAGITPGIIEQEFGYHIISGNNEHAFYQFIAMPSAPYFKQQHPNFDIQTNYVPAGIIAGTKALYVADGNFIDTFLFDDNFLVTRSLNPINTGSKIITLTIPKNTAARYQYLYGLDENGVLSQYDVDHLSQFQAPPTPTLLSSIRPPQRAVAMTVYSASMNDLVCTVTDQNNFQVFLSTGARLIPKLAYSASTGANPTAIAVTEFFLDASAPPVNNTPGQLNSTIK